MCMKCCKPSQLFLSILAIFLSPLAVLIHSGCSVTFLINILLFICGVLPGIIHAWFVIFKWSKFKRVLLSLLALVLPPIAVLFHVGCNTQLLINIILTILGFVPGIIHGWFVIWSK